jgi:hypothetical protein
MVVPSSWEGLETGRGFASIILSGIILRYMRWRIAHKPKLIWPDMYHTAQKNAVLIAVSDRPNNQ